MNLVRAGVAQYFEYGTYDANASLAFVAMTVLDLSGGSPVVVPMVHRQAGGYTGGFIPANGKSYLVTRAVYTDGTYSVLDTNYSPAHDTVYAEDASSGSGTGGSSTQDLVQCSIQAEDSLVEMTISTEDELVESTVQPEDIEI